MTTIYFVRHGESVANEGAWLAGHSEARLSARGEEQARQSAAQLARVPFDALLSSDLIRTVQTAQAHAEVHSLTPVLHSELREFDAGELTGMRYADIAERYPHLFPDAWRDRFGLFEPPGGESLPDAAARLHAFVLQCATRYPDRTLLFVTHAGILRAFWGRISGIDAAQLTQMLPFCHNGAYSLLQTDGEQIIPLAYNVTDAPQSDAERLW